ncbi:DPY30 domain-containing protein 2 [Mus pahari]|uniref:DPY30 domain-containing protein 2 n=1 Tax=Mus pahari TaxID=10093 RepID=UPI000A308D9F|nr:DPY30 domain-containing protein 2 [Mus pahari]XP_029397779.1 DPY30 domain-containing protein 2 [Mus pahari]XP_029397780.1 DPY30 domain-containing protein 2 [Mus pahari]
METAYLKKYFGNCLTQALAEVARVRPSDPIEYLAHWLYHYRSITIAEEKRRQEKLQLKEAHDRSSEEAKTTEMLKEEGYQIQQKCEKCHQELPSTSFSSDKTPALQEDMAPLEEKTMRQESQPGASHVISEVSPRAIPS